MASKIQYFISLQNLLVANILNALIRSDDSRKRLAFLINFAEFYN